MIFSYMKGIFVMFNRKIKRTLKIAGVVTVVVVGVAAVSAAAVVLYKRYKEKIAKHCNECEHDGCCACNGKYIPFCRKGCLIKEDVEVSPEDFEE